MKIEGELKLQEKPTQVFFSLETSLQQREKVSMMAALTLLVSILKTPLQVKPKSEKRPLLEGNGPSLLSVKRSSFPSDEEWPWKLHGYVHALSGLARLFPKRIQYENVYMSFTSPGIVSYNVLTIGQDYRFFDILEFGLIERAFLQVKVPKPLVMAEEKVDRMEMFVFQEIEMDTETKASSLSIPSSESIPSGISEENAKLKKANEVMQEENRELREKMAEELASKNEQNSKITRLEEQVKKIEEEKSSWQKQMDEMISSQKEMKKSLEDLQKKWEEEKSEKKKIQKDLEEERNSRAELQSLFEQRGNEVQRLKKRNKDLDEMLLRAKTQPKGASLNQRFITNAHVDSSTDFSSTIMAQFQPSSGKKPTVLEKIRRGTGNAGSENTSIQSNVNRK